MPYYDFVCNACNHKEEALVSHTVTELDCPKCEGGMRREFPNSVNHQFVGEGWTPKHHKPPNCS